MAKLEFEELLKAGVHFGHLKRKWNPKMAPYIFMEKNGIHLIDLNATIGQAEKAAAALKQIAKSGKKILFVATKKQAKSIVADEVSRVGMPYVTERWPGGMLTNFATIRKAVKKMSSIDKMMNDKQFDSISKRERLQIAREKAKLEKNLGSISDLNRLPSAIFIVDILKEHIAVAEARRLNIPTFAMVDTNTNPELIDFPIPANDDASKSIQTIVSAMVDAIEEGLAERKFDKEQAQEEEEEIVEAKDASADDDDDDTSKKRQKKGSPRKDIEGTEGGDDKKRPRKPSTAPKKVIKK